MKKTTRQATQDDLNFLKRVADDFDIQLSQKDAEKAFERISQYVSPDSADFYYAAKEYFLN